VGGVVAQIEEVKKRSENERAAFEHQMRERGEIEAKVFKQTEEELTRQLKIAQAQAETEGLDDFRKEHQAHRRLALKADDVENKIGVYDRDLTQKHEEITKLTATFQNESEELKRLTAHFAEVDTENRRIEQELKQLQVARDEEIARERQRHAAALLVHTLYTDHEAALKAAADRERRIAKREILEMRKAGIIPSNQKKVVVTPAMRATLNARMIAMGKKPPRPDG